MGPLTVIIPAYNEKQAIRKTLDELLPPVEKNGWQLIVVNDGSNDGTAEILDEFNHRLKVIHHPYNRGYGAALKTGIRAADTEFLALYDSDGQHRPEDLLLLYNEAPDYDLIIGERAEGSRVDVLRVPGKWLLTHAANFIVGRKIADINSGLRIFRRTFVKKIQHLLPDGFSFTSTSTVAALKMGFLVKFMPIQTRKRIGTSTVRQVRHGFMVLMLILRLVVLFSPLRIFIPVSITLAAVGVLYAAFVIATVRLTLANGALLCFVASMIIFFFGLVVDQISAMRRERYMNED
ncbi:MAG: glycosyltransferase family 2 protein [Desulfosarcina sp.]|nr:glycosyltransferase family 2 protein [Desulfobacterales bacterium]